MLLLIAVVCLAVVVPLYRHGIAASPFPAYLADSPNYQVKRYSAPWIAGAIALGGLGLVLILVAIGRLVAPREILPDPREPLPYLPSSYSDLTDAR